MPALFDGVTGLLNTVFGDPVTHHPKAGGVRTIHSVFREAPVEISDADGHTVLGVAPLWRVPQTEAEGIASGDKITLADGRRFEVLNRQPSASPASDRFVMFELRGCRA